MEMKKVTALVSAFAVSAVLIGGTLAYLNDTTDPVNNVFSSSKNIGIELREPTWDGYQFGDASYPNGATAKPDVENASSLGVNQAQKYVPGQNISKNPTVKNVGIPNGTENDGVSAKVALKVEYLTVAADDTTTALTASEFAGLYLNDNMNGTDVDTINFDTTTWTRIKTGTEASEYDVYLYNTTVAVGETTTALFTTVPISWDITPDSTTGLMPKFAIKVTAYAIQSDVPETELNTVMLNYITTATE